MKNDVSLKGRKLKARHLRAYKNTFPQLGCVNRGYLKGHSENLSRNISVKILINTSKNRKISSDLQQFDTEIAQTGWNLTYRQAFLKSRFK